MKTITKLLLFNIEMSLFEIREDELPIKEVIEGREMNLTPKEFKSLVQKALKNPLSETIIHSEMEELDEEVNYQEFFNKYKNFFYSYESQPTGFIYALHGTNEDITPEKETNHDGLVYHEAIGTTKNEAIEFFEQFKEDLNPDIFYKHFEKD